jgi:cell division septum initiation protein DivIVA
VQNANFPTAIRGYDRDEVHRYMRKVNTLIAELQITAAPESAIKAGLDQVRAERRSMLATAAQQAEEIAERSREEADSRLKEAQKEAAQLRAAAEREAEELREAAAQQASGTLVGAETRIRALQAHVERMQAQRDRAVEELVELSRILDELLEREGATGNGRTVPEPAHAER